MSAWAGVLAQGIQNTGDFISNLALHKDRVDRQNANTKWARAMHLRDRRHAEMREDTAIQRRAKDLEEAGINPMMAGLAGGGGAQAGNIIQGQSIAQEGSPTNINSSDIGGVVQNVEQLQQREKDLELREREIENSGKLKIAEIENLKSEVELRITQGEYTEEQIHALRTQNKKLIKEIETISIMNKRNKFREKYFDPEELSIIKNTKNLQVIEASLKMQLADLYAEQKRLTKNKANLIKHQIIQGYIREVSNALNTVNGIVRGGNTGLNIPYTSTSF